MDFLNGIPHSITLEGIRYTWIWLGNYLFTFGNGTCFSLHEHLGELVEQGCSLKEISILIGS
jgi:hypothetical protein